MCENSKSSSKKGYKWNWGHVGQETGLLEWWGIIPFDQPVPGSPDNCPLPPPLQKGTALRWGGESGLAPAGHEDRWLSGPGTAKSTQRGSEHQGAGARIPASGTRRGPGRRREPCGDVVLRAGNPKTKRPWSPPPGARP